MVGTGNGTDNGDRAGPLDESAGPADRAPAPVLLADLTYPELLVLKPSIDLVIIPVGAHEQHGPALPFATDTLIAQVMTALAGAMLGPRVAVAPAIPWGVSRSHMGYPGTVSLRESTLIDIVIDVVTSLHTHGFTQFLLVNTHGGNNATLRVAVERAHFEFEVPLVASLDAYCLILDATREVLGDAAIGHGGGDEAAAVYVARPDLVRTELLESPARNEPVRRVQAMLRAASGVLPVAQHKLTTNGASGDSTGATPEAGSEIVTRAASRLREMIEELLELDIDAGIPTIEP